MNFIYAVICHACSDLPAGEFHIVWKTRLLTERAAKDPENLSTIAHDIESLRCGKCGSDDAHLKMACFKYNDNGKLIGTVPLLEMIPVNKRLNAQD